MIWLILTRDKNDNPYPMDGEFYHTKEALYRGLNVADATDRVMAIDLAEWLRDGATNARDVTDDSVWDGLQCGSIEPGSEIASKYVTTAYRTRHHRSVFA